MAEVRAVFNIDSSQLAAEANPIIAAQLDALGNRIVSNAKQRAPVNTGNMRRTIGHRVISSASEVRLELFATAKYAGFVHDGTRPHVILPKNKTVLRFQTPRGVVFSRMVHHPGTRARAFLRDAIAGGLGP